MKKINKQPILNKSKFESLFNRMSESDKSLNIKMFFELLESLMEEQVDKAYELGRQDEREYIDECNKEEI
jgi:hypothetical protein